MDVDSSESLCNTSDRNTKNVLNCRKQHLPFLLIRVTQGHLHVQRNTSFIVQINANSTTKTMLLNRLHLNSHTV